MDVMNILNVTDLVLMMSGIASLILGFFVFIRDKNKVQNKAYFLISVGVFVWIVNLVLFNSFIFGQEFTIWFARIAYVGGLLIPIAALYFVTHFGKKTSGDKDMLDALSILFIVIALVTLVPGLVINTVNSSNGVASMTYGPLYIPYAAYLSGVFTLGFFYLWRRHYRASGRIKSQIQYFFIGSLIPASVSMVTNLVLPYFGDFRFFMVGPSVMIVMTVLIGYSIINYGLWDFRRIIAEILITILVVLSISNIIIPDSYFTDVAILLFRVLVILITLVVAFTLVHSFKKEQTQRKKLKKLNKRLKDMDKKKTEFLHIATHQLRGPVTVIKGYASLLQDGDYGKLTSKQVKILSNILLSSNVMTDTINDYMDIARIEEKRLKQEFIDFDLCNLIVERANAGTVRAVNKGINLILNKNISEECIINADKENIIQALNALIENAIKYTLEGTVTITVNKLGKKVQVIVADTGIGVDPKEIDGLFAKFSRASNAMESSIAGTGMGLFITKSLIEANHGSIIVDSEGINKGTTFTVELPLVNA